MTRKLVIALSSATSAGLAVLTWRVYGWSTLPSLNWTRFVGVWAFGFLSAVMGIFAALLVADALRDRVRDRLTDHGSVGPNPVLARFCSETGHSPMRAALGDYFCRSCGCNLNINATEDNDSQEIQKK